MRTVIYLALSTLLYSLLGILLAAGITWGAHPILLVPWTALWVLVTAILIDARRKDLL